jgi:hypothetical protein
MHKAAGWFTMDVLERARRSWGEPKLRIDVRRHAQNLRGISVNCES